jgi:hypothetical protein
MNRSCHPWSRPTHLLDIAEKQAKLVGYGADAVACPALLAQQNEEPIHICDLELGELVHTGVLEELPEAVSNSCDRSRRQTALDFTVTAESVDFLLVRGRSTIRFPQSVGETQPVARSLSKLFVSLFRAAATRIPVRTVCPSFGGTLNFSAFHWT